MDDSLKPDSESVDSQGKAMSSENEANSELDNSTKDKSFKSGALVVSQAAKGAALRMVDSYAKWHDLRSGEKDENYFSWLGWQVLIWGLGGALLWATFAPIEKGVSTSGWVMTDSNRKAIQPSFAGIVDDIFV